MSPIPPPRPPLPQSPIAKLTRRVLRVNTSTRESQVINNAPRVTSNDNVNSSRPNTQTTSSSKIPGQESTSRDPGLKPYWNDRARDLSMKLWLPTETDSPVSRLTSSPMSFHCTEQKSWFSMTSRPPTSRNSPMISLPSTPSISAECKENEPPSTDDKGSKKRKNKVLAKTARQPKKKPKRELNRTLQLHMYPNDHQKRLLKKWMGVSRLSYNTVVHWNKKRVKYENTSRMGPALRTWIGWDREKLKKTKRWEKLKTDKEAKNFWFGEEKFCRRMVALKAAFRGFSVSQAKNISDESITEALQSKAQIISRNIDRSSGKASRSDYRSRKALKHTISLRSQNFGKDDETWNKFYVRYMHSTHTYTIPQYKFVDTDGRLFPCHFETKRRNNCWPEPHRITSDCKLTYKRLTNDWIFSWCYTKDVQIRDNQADEEGLDVVSIDPGVRTPFTWYSPTKGAGKIGDGDKSRMIRMGLKLDDLVSRMDWFSKSTSKRKRKMSKRMRNAAARARLDIKHLQQEIHRKSARFFVMNFDVIVIPAFDSPSMSRRLHRKISSKTTRSMMSWAHGSFRELMKSKAAEFGKVVIIQDEAYTSKTCSNCGNIQRVNHIYKCRRCFTTIDRDENGARGILLRAMQRNALVFENTKNALVSRN